MGFQTVAPDELLEMLKNCEYCISVARTTLSTNEKSQNARLLDSCRSVIAEAERQMAEIQIELRRRGI